VADERHQTDDHSDLLTVGQVVERLLAESALRGAQASCALPTYWVDNHWRFRRRDLEMWIAVHVRRCATAVRTPSSTVRDPIVSFMSRGDQPLRLMARYDRDAHDYVLLVHRADGRQQTERFGDAPAFRERLGELEHGSDD
jgi:hypothetical protein